MPVEECMARHTVRQRKAWDEWFKLELNNPSRTDHHLMQISQQLDMLLSATCHREWRERKLKEYAVRFVFEKPKPDPDGLTEAQLLEAEKAIFCALAGGGMPVEVRTVKRSELTG